MSTTKTPNLFRDWRTLTGDHRVGNLSSRTGIPAAVLENSFVEFYPFSSFGAVNL
ncbi:hypothetical protein MtrunA17_Chr1g0174891 [Medicago truncatula]|uniref:Uncharacterized protein n=1 Tax=Medicago truncatula TaxID=3880 RepID=A0A396JWZ2_MEDTR|nr:hypothetical protein MtrunA17_Chr1g0174891 [Medicago truncatula]